MSRSEDKPSGMPSRIELEILVDKLTEMLPAQLKVYPLQAKARKAKFDALVREGFSETQALEIVKATPVFE